MAFSAMGFLFSALTNKAATVRNMAMAWFIISFLFGGLVAQLYYTDADDASADGRTGFSWLAPIE